MTSYYTPTEIENFLTECVTIVKPGETLVVRCKDLSPRQLYELQDSLDYANTHSDWPKIIAVPGDELAVIATERNNSTHGKTP